MEVITSPNNNLIKTIKKLKQRKYRESSGKFLIEGINLVEEALLWKNDVEQIVISMEFLEKTNEQSRWLKNQLEQNKISTIAVSNELFETISETKTPQGIMAIVVKRNQEHCQYSSKDNGNNYCSLILNNIQDPGNLGTLMRTADAAGFTEIILTKGTVDPYNHKVLRAAMGAHFHLSIRQILDEEVQFISELKRNKIKILVAHVNDNAKNPYTTTLKPPLALVLGNEANGPDDDWLQAADHIIKIPIIGRAESLNVSIAGAVLMYEIIRQNKFDHC